MSEFQCPASGGCARGDLPGECRAHQLRSPTLCLLADPASPTYRPEYRALLRGEPAPAKPKRPDVAMPSLLARAASLAGAVAQHVKAGRPKASAEDRADRLAICHQCENFQQGTCRLCGCGMALKVSWADMSCPDGKWGPVEAQKEGATAEVAPTEEQAT